MTRMTPSGQQTSDLHPIARRNRALSVSPTRQRSRVQLPGAHALHSLGCIPAHLIRATTIQTTKQWVPHSSAAGNGLVWFLTSPDKPQQARRRLLVCLSDCMGSFEMLHEKKAQKLVAETGE